MFDLVKFTFPRKCWSIRSVAAFILWILSAGLLVIGWIWRGQTNYWTCTALWNDLEYIRDNAPILNTLFYIVEIIRAIIDTKGFQTVLSKKRCTSQCRWITSMLPWSPHSLLTKSLIFLFSWRNQVLTTPLKRRGEWGNGSTLNRTGNVTVHMT